MVYDQAATIALFQALRYLLVRDRVMFLALEKRFNFELSSLSVQAHGYEVFLEQFCCDVSHWDPSSRACPTCTCVLAGERPRFRGRRISVESVPQVFVYERTSALELWELRPL